MSGRACIVVCVASAAGCFAPELPTTRCERGFCPAGFICETTTRTCIRPGSGGLFGQIERIAEVEDFDLTDPTATDDLLEVYFERNDPDGSDDIFVSTRSSTDDPWSEPVEIGGELASGESFSPEISRDGLSLSISRRDAGTETIHLATRPDRSAEFADAGEISELRGGEDTTHLSVSADGTVGVFDSNRMSNGNGRQLFEVRRDNPGDRWGRATRPRVAHHRRNPARPEPVAGRLDAVLRPAR